MKNLFEDRLASANTLDGSGGMGSHESRILDLLRELRTSGKTRLRPEKELPALGVDFDIGPNG